MKKALITGVTGQDGSYLAELLLSKKYIVVGIIRRSSYFNTYRIDHLIKNKNFKLIYGDVTDYNSIYYAISHDDAFKNGWKLFRTGGTNAYGFVFYK